MLAGATRVKLMRQMHEHPGGTVSELAQRVGIGLSDASQELRRIQSRGLLQVERLGACVYYRFGADPQVPSAAPLLQALKSALADHPQDRDPEIARIAKGLAHPRRMAMAKQLTQTPLKLRELQAGGALPISSASLHVRTLIQSGLVGREGRWLLLKPATHPVARALVRLLKD